ncbi:MAG: RidA family protein [Bacteroidetes bacterium]|nr:RidA family protein [Bacteroidota bacterium]MDA1121451.1 RidA family protein [Bacteroidota bacterium]
MMKKLINTTNAPQPIGPYSQAVIANDLLFISGQIAIDPSNGSLVTDNIEDETSQVLENIRAILLEAGLNFTNVVKCSIFVKDMADFSRINAVYGKYFTTDPPARETVEVSGLPKNVNVEISCIATIN